MMQAFAEMDAISDCLVREVVEADAEKLLAYYNVIASEPRNNTGVRHGMIPQQLRNSAPSSVNI